MGPNVTKEQEDQFLNTILLLSLTRFPFYNHALEFVKKYNGTLVHIKRSEIAQIMMRVSPDYDKGMFNNLKIPNMC